MLVALQRCVVPLGCVTTTSCGAVHFQVRSASLSSATFVIAMPGGTP